jgi:hypothetical protein
MNNVLQYRRERLPLKLVLPVGFLLAMTGAFVSESTSRIKMTLDVMLAVLFVSQFRLWDDLRDVDSDRIQHPDRILCRQENLWPFRLTVTLMFIVNGTAVLASRAFGTAIAFAAINMVFSIWYNRLRLSCGTWANSIFILTKYPAFLFVLVDGTELRQKTSLAVAMIVVFAAACIYEVLHNLRI